MTLVAGAAAASVDATDFSIKTLTIRGYGQQAYQNGGGNITASLDAPQKWVNVNGLKRTIDFGTIACAFSSASSRILCSRTFET